MSASVAISVLRYLDMAPAKGGEIFACCTPPPRRGRHRHRQSLRPCWLESIREMLVCITRSLLFCSCCGLAPLSSFACILSLAHFTGILRNILYASSCTPPHPTEVLRNSSNVVDVAEGVFHHVARGDPRQHPGGVTGPRRSVKRLR